MKTDKDYLLKINLFLDNEYLEKYVNLINENEFTKKEKYYQAHHIIPKCCYKYAHKNINNSDENLVNLKYSNHILAHFYLYKCAKDAIKPFLGNIAFKMLNEYKEIDKYTELEILLNKDVYDDLYRQAVISNSGDNAPFKGKTHSKEVREKISKKLKGRKQSPEAIEKVRQSHIGSKHSEETKQKMSASQKGRKVCHDENGKIHYYNPNLGETLPESCIEGYTEEHKKYLGEQIKKYYSQHKPWNYGISTPDDIRQKISESNKGKKRTQEWRKNISKALKGLKKRPHTPEELKRISEDSKNRVWINKGGECKFIKDFELEDYLNNGYKRGRK